MEITSNTIVVAGAGLAGGLLACYLRKRGFDTHVVERRPDPRSIVIDGGRSINLALSERGIDALKGIGLLDDVLGITIPMYGRMIHTVDSQTIFQPYSTDGKECIRSVSRLELNKRLIDCAEKAGAKLHFEKQITRFSSRSGELFFTDHTKVAPATVVATDGAYSPVRRSVMNMPNFDYTQKYHAHGYKELCIPPIEGTNKHRLEPINALHIWPRGTYMMIALPNTDGSFTCTVFMPNKGEISFESLNTDEKVLNFFTTQFPDALPLMPTFMEDWKNNPTSGLMTVSCFPWSWEGKMALLGDACHAVVPFFGQGMNCAFEDVAYIDKCLDEAGSTFNPVTGWEPIFKKYEVYRKPNADAILAMALENYIEMRDKVADKNFQFRSKVAAKVGKAFPNQFKTRYELVSFSTIPYTQCIERGLINDSIIDELVKNVTDFDPEKVDMNLAKQLVEKHFPLA